MTKDSRIPEQRRVFGTNLKMNQTPDETTTFLRELARELPTVLDGHDDVQCFVIPPFTSLPAAVEVAREAPVPMVIGAQTMHEETDGNFTGEISARMLKALGVDFVLLGHAERRALFGETDAGVRLKVQAALAAELSVLVCVGESRDERDWGVADESVSRQLKIALGAVSPADIDRVMIAYEPIWSIGPHGTPATLDAVVPVIRAMRLALDEVFGADTPRVPILYGGSVNPESSAIFGASDDLDGVFVGRAAWTADGYTQTLAAMLDASPNRE